jgi:tetratricopeptide (TPR) repeat protein
MTDRQTEQNFQNIRDSVIKTVSVETLNGNLIVNGESAQPPTGATVLLTQPPKPAPHQQPRAKTSEVRECLRSGAIVGISGISGVGKTTIAAALYGEAASIGFERRLWLDFSSAPTVDAIADAMLIELGGKAARDLAGLETQQRCNAALRVGAERGCLVVLDNLETALTEAGEWRDRALGEFWANWSRVAAASALLVTSQVRPRLWREASVARWESLGGFEAAAGAEFLAAAGVRGSAAELERLSELVSGHPLTLRLAASYLVLVCGGDLARSEGRELLEFEAIAAKPTGDHRGIAASLAWLLERHWQQLSPEQQGFLGRLCVYRVPIDRELAAGMLDGATLDEARLALVALADRSLLRRLEDGRYRVEPLVARYVAGLGLEAAHDRAIAVFEGRKLPREAWKLEGDIADYVELVFHYVQVGALQRAFYTVRDNLCSENCLQTWLERRGYRRTLIRVYEEVLAAWQDETDWCYGAMLTSVGNAYQNLGQAREAIAFHERSLANAREIGKRQGEAASLGNLGNTYKGLGQVERAIELHQQSLTIKREIGDRQGEANSLRSLGNAYQSLGQFERVIELNQQSLTIKREIGNRQGEAFSLRSLGNAYQSLGQFERAIELHQQSLTIEREIGNRQGEAVSLGNLGNAYQSLVQFKLAIELYQQYNKIAREIGDRQGEAASLGNLGVAYSSLGQFERAIELHQQSLTIAREIGNRQGEANSLNNLGNVYKSLNRIDIAREHFQAARQLFQTLQQPHFVKICDDNLAELDSPQKSDFSKKSDFFARLRQLWRRFRQFIRRLLS